MNKIQINELLDYYGGLLTPKQQEICRYYFRDDYSYQEIAELMNVSRSAVYDVIKRCRNELNRFEEILKLIEMRTKRQDYYDAIEKLTHDQQIIELIQQCRQTEFEGGNYE